MKFLPSRTLASRELRPRAPFERRLRAVEFVVLGMGTFVMAIFVSSARYEKSVLRAEEATRKQDLFVVCSAARQYTLDKQTEPKSLEDLVQAKYLAVAPRDPITHEKYSLMDCAGGPAGGPEDHMDPVRTIPGFGRL